jgi:hypothetical protein
MKERKTEAFLNVYRHNDHLQYCQKLHQRDPSQPAIERKSHVTLKKKKSRVFLIQDIHLSGTESHTLVKTSTL